MTRDYNIAILAVIKMIVANNAGCVSRKLRDVGYENKNFIPSSELESALFQLHITNPDMFFQVISNCEWNHGNNNWTNDEKYRQQIIDAVKANTGIDVDKSNWWITVINHLKKQYDNK